MADGLAVKHLAGAEANWHLHANTVTMTPAYAYCRQQRNLCQARDARRPQPQDRQDPPPAPPAPSIALHPLSYPLIRFAVGNPLTAKGDQGNSTTWARPVTPAGHNPNTNRPTAAALRDRPSSQPTGAGAGSSTGSNMYISTTMRR